MKFLNLFENFIVEKSIGSENIRTKHYSDIPKDIFYKIINIDPTSIRKKEFSKPGKYSKWLLREFKSKRLTLERINDDQFRKKLNYYLFIFSTNWYKSKSKESSYYLSGEIHNPIKLDILKFKLFEFTTEIQHEVGDYEIQTEKSKFDIVYSDEKVDILVPLNFTASYETAKNTEWCSQSFGGYSDWNQRAILYRIIPKNKEFEKLKLTWLRKESRWYIASQKYPEISGNGTPFDMVGGDHFIVRLEKWKSITMNILNDKEIWKKESYENILKSMQLLSKDAKEAIVNNYNQNKSK